MSVLSENIKKWRTLRGYTLAYMGDKLGVTEATFQRYESGLVKNIKYEHIVKMAEVYNIAPQILMGWSSAEDLLDPKILKGWNSLQDLPAGAVAVSKRKVPLIRADASCGSGVPSCDDTEVEKLISIDNDIDVDYAIYAHGDSMEGARIYDGDIVFVKKCNAEQLIDGEIGLFQIENETLIKRIRRDTKNHIIWLYAENSKYTPEPITGERLENLKVLGKCIILQALLK